MTPEAVQHAPPAPIERDGGGLLRPASVGTSVPSSTDAPNERQAPEATEAPDGGPAVDDLAEHAAEKICEGFLMHDRRDREGAVEAFFAVDRLQFAHLDAAAALEAAEAFVDALWAKDAVEAGYVEADGSEDDPEDFDDAGLAAADWRPVADALARRAEVVGMDPAYATATTLAWCRHKTGGDYWTPTLRAQAHEVRAAMGEAGTAKNRHGQSGFGHLPARYLVGLELHDMRTEAHWKQAAVVMTPYFAEILAAHGGDR